MLTAIALSAVVIVYNNVANRWRPFHGVAYVPINLTFAGAAVAVAAMTSHLSAGDLGIGGELRRALLPLAIVGLFAFGAFGLALSRHGRLIADERVAGMRGNGLVFYALVRIPIGTAVVEELLFRGVLFATWRSAGTSPFVAALCASIAFGLWHIAPTVIGVRLNDPGATKRKLSAAVVGAILATTVAGLGLTWLRVWSGGLLGPIVMHAGINSVGALAAVVAHRQVGSGSPERRD